ncbi:MAG: AraC family transcriptional regulator [Opitutae bacterium]|nr:AraC family transcriptional regulator [Opitutae bacterium]MDG1302127.1 AraC family transcriptional regulator [Opitutae bacterium]
MLKPQRLISDPPSYYHGVDLAERVVCRNVLLFERLNKSTLQQKHLANRMHHRYVLIRVQETSGVVSVDGKGLKLGVGDCLLIAPYQFHSYVDVEQDDLRWTFITFEVIQGQQWLQGMGHKVLKLDSTARAYWDEIVAFWISGKDFIRSQVLPSLDRLLMHLRLNVINMDAVPSVAPPLAGQHEWITRVEGLIIQSIGEGWNLAEVARRAKISERHLRTRFEAAMGISLREYRTNYQLHRAISLMRDAQLSLSDVAELCGFNSLSSFSRFVRHQTELSPRELRKSLGRV